MVNFEQIQESRLFASDSNVEGAGWWGFQAIPEDPEQKSYSLERALSDTKLDGTFIYTAEAPDFSKQSVTGFIKKIDEILDPLYGTRAIIWLPTGDADSIDLKKATPPAVPLGMSGGKVKTIAGLTVTLTGEESGVTAELASGAELTTATDGNGLFFSGNGSPVITLGGAEAPQVYQPENNALLHFTGNILGTFTFFLFIKRESLLSDLNWGFQAVVPNPEAQANGSDTPTLEILPYLSSFLPLASGQEPVPTDAPGFNVQLNMVNPNNLLEASATVFWYTGQNSSGSTEKETRLVSYYRTNYGKTVVLSPVVDSSSGQQPAGMVFNPAYLSTPLQNGFRFSPVGDFVMDVEQGSLDETKKLMCGLSGPETIAFLPAGGDMSKGYRLRFLKNKPANVPQFPLKEVSPVGPPIDPAALLMNTDNNFMTSWATVVAPPSSNNPANYTAAPKGADLFGKDDLIHTAVPQLLGPKDPGLPLPDEEDFSFPLFPMAGFASGTGEQDMTTPEIEMLNRQIVGPTRRHLITKANAERTSHPVSGLPLPGTEYEDGAFNVTTPTGFIANVENGIWKALLLAQVTELGSAAVERQMGFTKPHSLLQAAFQTDNLFLVAANANNLGDFSDGIFMPPATQKIPDTRSFYNTINIEDWKFTANVGQKNRYDNYRNVMIVKGVRGKLTDLVISPDKWTQKDIFAAPSTLDPGSGSGSDAGDPDISQLIPLSNWLSRYLQGVLENKDNPYFQDFARIIEDENWTGVLILKVDVRLPSSLAGVIAGVDDPEKNLFAHHLGIEISQIDGTEVQQKDSSSLFGLVYYVNPDYDDSEGPHTIAPKDLNATFDFTLLTLKALFKNTRVAKFESLAQLVLNKIYGSAVKKLTVTGKDGKEEPSNVYNAILLEGAYQLNGDAPVYSLASTETNFYDMNNNILDEVVIETAQMSTRDDGSTGGKVVSWIAMSGYMTFAVLEGTSGSDEPLPDFDIFSFGMENGGLSFSNLGIKIEYSDAESLEMVEEEIAFNTAASKAREYSLFPNFQMELQGLVTGSGDNSPDGMGYATVATAYGLQGVSGKDWHGLVFKLNMGTPGALAAKINLSSALMLAWADDSGAQEGDTGYQALVGLQLPGAGAGGELFSLQTVIKLSVGMIRLDYNDDPKKKSFLLLLNEIALKFLGLLKIPPNGATSFFLFGNPDAKDSTGLGWYAIYNQDQKKPDCSKTSATISGERKQISV